MSRNNHPEALTCAFVSFKYHLELVAILKRDSNGQNSLYDTCSSQQIYKLVAL